MLLDIVILPPVKLRQKISKKIKKAATGYPNFFIVDNRKLISHLSLWHIRTSKNRINELAKELKQIVKNQKPIKINSVGFTASKEYQSVEFTVKNNRALTSLQQEVFKRIYPFKIGMMPFVGIFRYTKVKQIKEAKKYGRPLGFQPHFTAGVLKSMIDSLRIAESMKKTKFNFSFSAKEIYICEVNHWWQVTKIIRKISFGK